MKTKKEIIGFAGIILLFWTFTFSSQQPSSRDKPATSLLQLLNIIPSPQSLDYIKNRAQFYQDHLTTEQRHSRTLNFSQMILEDIQSGLRQLFSVETDIEKKLNELSLDPGILHRIVGAVEAAILSGNRIYIYGGGASGRLAMQMESTFWRPFWKRVHSTGKLAKKIGFLSKSPIEDRLVGEMTGGDRALMGSMENLEDLPLLGWLQLQERRIKKGDVVICLAESGETPAVIGALQAAVELWKNAPPYQSREARQKLFFIHNNPEEQLFLFDRCRNILEEPGITKVDLTTGPQSITGSTRSQAATINTLVLGHVLQTAVFRCLQRYLSKKEMARIGFSETFVLSEKLTEYSSFLKEIKKHLPHLAEFTSLEAEVQARGGKTIYFAHEGFFSALNDLNGRAGDFHLPFPGGIEESSRKSSVQLWTGASSNEDAWEAFLGRVFRGLTPSFYLKPIADVVADPVLKLSVQESLKNAGTESTFQYDFSMTAPNLTQRGPLPGDLGVCVLVSPEKLEPDKDKSNFGRFMRLFAEGRRHLAVLWITDSPEKVRQKAVDTALASKKIAVDVLIPVHIDGQNDPLGVNRQVALKVLLNIHSTAVMASLGKITGNYLTHVNPANFKLVGRATHILQSLVNDTVNRPSWVERYGLQKSITFGEANAVLLASRNYLQQTEPRSEQTSEVALSVIHILESLRRQKGLVQKEAFVILKNRGLNRYLAEILR